MTWEPPGDATVLVIEDERHLADLYADYLDDAYGVITAYGGEEGLSRLHEDVDVVVVDRRMSVLSGNEVLAAIEERDVDCRTALITSATPDFDIIELGVDDYLVKPVTRDDALAVVDRLLALTAYTDALRSLTRKKLTRNVLQIEKSPAELAESERYEELETDVRRLQDTVDSLVTRLDLEERSVTL